MNNQSVKIGIPDLNEDNLIELVDYIDDSIRNYLFSKIKLKYLDDFNINIELDNDQELSLSINIELFFHKFEIANIDDFLNDAIEIGVKALKEKINDYKKTGKNKNI
ncbi:MAG: DUF3194 domain-containing protein [Candidatus Helarchaeota archaeon]